MAWAKFISGGWDYKKQTKTLMYEYKGEYYIVTDYRWYGTGAKEESLAYQHRQEQARIDRGKAKEPTGEELEALIAHNAKVMAEIDKALAEAFDWDGE